MTYAELRGGVDELEGDHLKIAARDVVHERLAFGDGTNGEGKVKVMRRRVLMEAPDPSPRPRLGLAFRQHYLHCGEVRRCCGS